MHGIVYNLRTFFDYFMQGEGNKIVREETNDA